jgi:predicted GIY-YIG superfamily endonuclease
MFHYVYILKSEVAPERHYIGMTSDLTQRLAAHNLARFRIPQNSNLGLSKPL